MAVSYSVVFNDNDISEVPGVFLYYYDSTDLPDRDIKIHKLARRSLSIITSSEYTQKDIRVLMRVCSGERHDTEQAIINIKGLLQPQNGELVVRQGDEELKYTATMNEFNIEWQGATAWVEIVFIASTPIAEGSTSNTLFSFNTTTASAGASFIVGGSYLAEPVISIKINSVTGGTGSISIFNSSTNQGITLNGTFTSGDQIEIDCRNYTITLNGGNIDFEGIFLTFPPGAQRVGYTDTFTTRNVDVTGTYNAKVV